MPGCLFGWLFFPRKQSTKMPKDIKIVCNHIVNLWKKVLRIELSCSREGGTCGRPKVSYKQVPEAKMLF